MTDHIAIDIQRARYIVALTDVVAVIVGETFEQQYPRGLYTFTSLEKAEAFTSLCNNVTEGYGDIAFIFKNERN